MANFNWRTINIDLLDPESPANFSTASLQPASTPVTASEVQGFASQVRQSLRGGDTEGALRRALENAPYGGDSAAKVRQELRWFLLLRKKSNVENEAGSSSRNCGRDIAVHEAIGYDAYAEQNIWF